MNKAVGLLLGKVYYRCDHRCNACGRGAEREPFGQRRGIALRFAGYDNLAARPYLRRMTDAGHRSVLINDISVAFLGAVSPSTGLIDVPRHALTFLISDRSEEHTSELQS